MKRFFLMSLAWTCLNCGSTDTQEPQTGSGGSQDQGSGGSTDGSGGRASGTGGASDASGGDDAGGAGPDADCSGNFVQQPRMILAGGRVTSPALSADNLELFYVRGESYDETFMVSHRNSTRDVFPEGTALDELNEFEPCLGLNKTLDASADGLRVYISCYTDVDLYTPLYQFERPSRDAPFESPIEHRALFASSGISVDELTLVGSRFESDVATFASTRTALDQPFSEPKPLPGLENVALFGPTLSRDGLQLYGALGTEKRLSAARRPDLDSPFDDEFLDYGALVGDLMTAGAPDLSDDCRTLVFVGVDDASNWALYQADR